MSKGISDINISTQMQLWLFLVGNIIQTGSAQVTQRVWERRAMTRQ